jgi:hypothetical protein
MRGAGAGGAAAIAQILARARAIAEVSGVDELARLRGSSRAPSGRWTAATTGMPTACWATSSGRTAGAEGPPGRPRHSCDGGRGEVGAQGGSATAASRPDAADRDGTGPPGPGDETTPAGELALHPLAELFPLMGPAEFEVLVASIAANGQREPIVVHEGRIVDGRNRYLACRRLGREPAARAWDGRGSLVAFVVDRNLERRHLSASQRALLAVQLKRELAAEARTNMRRDRRGLADLPTLHSRDRAAAAVNVSSRLVGQAERVVARGMPELIAAVRRGEVTASAASEVVELGAAEQAALVAGGAGAVRAAARRLRGAGGPTGPRPTAAPWGPSPRPRRGGWRASPCGPGWRTRPPSTSRRWSGGMARPCSRGSARRSAASTRRCRRWTRGSNPRCWTWRA